MAVCMWLSHLFKVKTLYLSQEFGERETSRKFYFSIREVFFFKEYLKDIHCMSDRKPKGSGARTISHWEQWRPNKNTIPRNSWENQLPFLSFPLWFQELPPPPSQPASISATLRWATPPPRCPAFTGSQPPRLPGVDTAHRPTILGASALVRSFWSGDPAAVSSRDSRGDWGEWPRGGSSVQTASFGCRFGRLAGEKSPRAWPCPEATEEGKGCKGSPGNRGNGAGTYVHHWLGGSRAAWAWGLHSH